MPTTLESVPGTSWKKQLCSCKSRSNPFMEPVERSSFTHANHARIRSWNQLKEAALLMQITLESVPGTSWKKQLYSYKSRSNPFLEPVITEQLWWRFLPNETTEPLVEFKLDNEPDELTAAPPSFVVPRKLSVAQYSYVLNINIKPGRCLDQSI